MRSIELSSVEEFQTFAEVKLAPKGTKVKEIHPDVMELNRRIIVEEIKETMEKGIRPANIVETADGLGDVVYTVAHAINHLGRQKDRCLDQAALVLLAEARQRIELILGGNTGFLTEDDIDRNLSYADIVARGIAAVYNIPLDEIFAEIHRSNMTKKWPDGKCRKDAGGKVLKPDGYERPQIRKVLDAGQSSKGS